MSFVSRRIARPPGIDAWPDRAIYHADEIGQLHELADYVDAARRTADAAVECAQRAAAALEERVAHEQALRQRHADEALLRRAIALEAVYRAGRTALLARLEGVLDGALETALRRIGAEMPTARRIGVIADELRRQIEPGPLARLHVSVADEAACRAESVELPWALRVDETLPPGTCRLSSDAGEWVLAFDAFIETCATARYSAKLARPPTF
jgi:flagellar biosynthesis/type III secretory pathway protein FliH